MWWGSLLAKDEMLILQIYQKTDSSNNIFRVIVGYIFWTTFSCQHSGRLLFKPKEVFSFLWCANVFCLFSAKCLNLILVLWLRLYCTLRSLPFAEINRINRNEYRYQRVPYWVHILSLLPLSEVASDSSLELDSFSPYPRESQVICFLKNLASSDVFEVSKSHILEILSLNLWNYHCVQIWKNIQGNHIVKFQSFQRLPHTRLKRGEMRCKYVEPNIWYLHAWR